MTDYKDIIGLDVEAKSDNPTNVITGEIWFNTTTGKLRYKKPDGAAAWSTGGDLNVGRRFHGGSGTQTAALAFGGIGVTPPHAGISQALSEEYNGEAWTEGNELNTARYSMADYGTQTAAGSVGGFGPGSGSTIHENYNGTSWSETTDTNSNKRYAKGDGTQTAALVHTFDGTELYNGSSWTEVNDVNQTALFAASSGESTAALSFGGSPNGSATSAKTESWNGTS